MALARNNNSKRKTNALRGEARVYSYETPSTFYGRRAFIRRNNNACSRRANICLTFPHTTSQFASRGSCIIKRIIGNRPVINYGVTSRGKLPLVNYTVD